MYVYIRINLLTYWFVYWIVYKNYIWVLLCLYSVSSSTSASPAVSASVSVSIPVHMCVSVSVSISVFVSLWLSRDSKMPWLTQDELIHTGPRWEEGQPLPREPRTGAAWEEGRPLRPRRQPEEDHGQATPIPGAVRYQGAACWHQVILLRSPSWRVMKNMSTRRILENFAAFPGDCGVNCAWSTVATSAAKHHQITARTAVRCLLAHTRQTPKSEAALPSYNSELVVKPKTLHISRDRGTGWWRGIGCLLFHRMPSLYRSLPQKCPIISGSLAERDLLLGARQAVGI